MMTIYDFYRTARQYGGKSSLVHRNGKDYAIFFDNPESPAAVYEHDPDSHNYVPKVLAKDFNAAMAWIGKQ